MKLILPLLLTLFLYNYSGYAQTNTTSSKEKVDITLTDGGKAVFFVENLSKKEDASILALHKKNSDSIYRMFGGATTTLLVGRTNAQSFKSVTKLKSWYVYVKDLKRRTAMIMIDGNTEPTIEYDPDKYIPIVRKKFVVELTQRKSSMKQERWGEEAAESNLQLKLETKFTPDASYAAALIRNANTMEYPLPPFPEDPVMKGSYSFVSYTDSTQKTATVKALYIYLNDGTNRFKSTEMDYLNGTKNKIVYYYSPLGLLDSMKSFTNGKPDYTLKYKYLHDRYISYTNNNDNSRREFIFNTLKQVATIKDFDGDNTISMYRSFKFDDKGRILTESRYKDYYTLEGKMEYTYNDSNSKVLATLKTYDNDKLTYELSRQKQGNHFVQKNKSIYGYESSSIDNYSKDGAGLSKNYTNGKMSGYFVTQKIAD
jgi:hypothetical protein